MYHFLIKKLVTKPTYSNPIVNPDCTEFEVNNWELSLFIIRDLIPIVGIKPFPLSELQLMVASICRFKPEYIFDWGTHIGKSARIFYETCLAYSIKSRIYSIDLPEDVEHIEHPHEKRGQMVKNIPGVTLLLGDGVTEATKIAKQYSNANCLFFLDGDHSYSSVKHELKTIISTVKNPVILVHDTFFQSEKSLYNIGPYNAVTEFLYEHPDFKSISTNTGLPGITCLYNL